MARLSYAIRQFRRLDGEQEIDHEEWVHRTFVPEEGDSLIRVLLGPQRAVLLTVFGHEIGHDTTVTRADLELDELLFVDSWQKRVLSHVVLLSSHQGGSGGGLPKLRSVYTKNVFMSTVLTKKASSYILVDMNVPQYLAESAERQLVAELSVQLFIF